MKTLLALLVLVSSPAHAASTACDTSLSAAKLTYQILPTRMGTRILASFSPDSASTVQLSGLQSFDQEHVASVYQLSDAAGQPALLKLATRSRTLPCGRGACDPDRIITIKTAELTYLGATTSFRCHASLEE